MIVFVKLLLAHLIGDFVLQPNSWIRDKNAKKLKSSALYIHILLHGALAWLLVFDWRFGGYAVLLLILHGLIDALKLYFQTDETERIWFIVDQALHLLVLIGIALAWNRVDLTRYEIDERFWVYLSAVLLLTTPASIGIKKLISIWTPQESDVKQADLQNAGKYIGMLERLFVFFFIVSGHFASIGFLMAAKSIFRFGDLTKSNDRRLTEYVLIGTLTSFAMAIAIGFLTTHVLKSLC